MARQILPLCSITGMGAVWYSPSRSKPLLLSLGDVQVTPPSSDRRMIKFPWCFQVPMIYRTFLCTNRFDQNCPLISEIFFHDFPLLVDLYTAVTARSCSVDLGPKWSCEAT